MHLSEGKFIHIIYFNFLAVYSYIGQIIYKHSCEFVSSAFTRYYWDAAVLRV
jgi:hypothetical protein